MSEHATSRSLQITAGTANPLSCAPAAPPQGARLVLPRGRAPRGRRGQRGSALLGAMMMGIAVFGLIAVTTLVSSTEVRESKTAIDDLKARALAQSAIEVGFEFLGDVSQKATHDPVGGLAMLFTAEDSVPLFVDAEVSAGDPAAGTMTLTATRTERTATSITIQLDATGYLPAIGTTDRPRAWHSTSVTARYELEASEVFDYAYFVNNWGWLYGSTIYCYGNARSNGQFDVANYKPTITGQPTYDGLDWNASKALLSGYRDDNGDGLEDGNDGGIFSGWDIVGAKNVKGNGGDVSNQHDFDGQIDMPNLSDLTAYKAYAISEGGSLSIGGSKVSNAVYGDEVGEQQNIYLHGTKADPIELDGPVVIEGDVIISGYVTGQGVIYAGGNIYCPDSVLYKKGPPQPRPAQNSQAVTEAWITAHSKQDFLGLFAAENIVVGDHTDNTWRHYVSGWMASPMNGSAEDAGEDGIPNTADGMDGIPGTADDDVLEGDGIFTVEYYTQSDADYGLIPTGKKIGDPIPGTGEDIDGDGVKDDTTDLTDIDFDDPLDVFNWGGNMPLGGIANYSDVATLYANQLDAAFYTNHSFCYVVFGNKKATINGALVTRNENIIYGTPSLEFNYDCRLLGGNDGIAGGMLPQKMGEPEILRWTDLDRDPNRYAVAP